MRIKFQGNKSITVLRMSTNVRISLLYSSSVGCSKSLPLKITRFYTYNGCLVCIDDIVCIKENRNVLSDLFSKIFTKFLGGYSTNRKQKVYQVRLGPQTNRVGSFPRPPNKRF